MSNIMLACIIMYNMIIEDEKGLHLEPFRDWGIQEPQMKVDFSFRES